MSATRHWQDDALAEVRRDWRTLIGATLGIAVGLAALPFYTAGVFVKAFEQDFGWTRSQLSFVSLVGTLTIILCAPMAGYVVDRFGVRSPAAVSLAALAAGFMSLSMMSGSLAVFVALQVLLYACAIASTPIGFTRAISERFVAARGDHNAKTNKPDHSVGADQACRMSATRWKTRLCSRGSEMQAASRSAIPSRRSAA